MTPGPTNDVQVVKGRVRAHGPADLGFYLRLSATGLSALSRLTEEGKGMRKPHTERTCDSAKTESLVCLFLATHMNIAEKQVRPR
jgi:hypothetical protein